MRENANIAAHADPDIRPHRHLECATVLLNTLRRGFLAVPTLKIARVSLRGAERRTIADAAIVHHLEDFGRSAVAVLDGIDSGEDRAAHSLGGGRMGSCNPARIMSDRYARGHFLLSQCGARRLARKVMVIGVHLDDVV